MDNTAGYIYHLNAELLEDERIFKLSSARLNRDNSVIITLIVRAADYDALLTAELQDKVETITRNLVPNIYSVSVVYKKTISDESYIIQCVNDFVYNESPLVFRKLDDCVISVETAYDTITVRMALPPYVYSFMEANGYAEKLADYLDALIMEHIEVELSILSGASTPTTLIKRKPKEQAASKPKVIEVSELVSVVGAITRMPKYISEAITSESDNQTICGKVVSITQKTAKSTGKPFFTLKLDDTTAAIEGVYFAKDEAAAESFAKEVPSGIEVCVEGPVKLSRYNNSLSIQIRRISRCIINYASIKNDIVYLGAEDTYITIQPQPYIEQQQAGLFDTIAAIHTDLMGEIVVFDLETTGLNPSSDRIIEIGAVKMKDGIIIESFSTLINPQMPIPAEASSKNNIYDEDVANSPTIAQVIGDFYKFTRGAVLAGHNIEGFDCNFLSYWGKQHKYNFDNDTADTLKIAKIKLPNIKHNLGALCKRFDIDLINAHRAMYDAEATAKLYKKLLEL